jgi:GMP synthase (glutamine-hydrolysing)
MKPVLILQHLSGDGPAGLATWLQQRGVPFEVRCSEAGQAFPPTLAGYGALAILGGEMSANDDLPPLRQAERLFLQALQAGVPTLGHCLGGQLMARALGGTVGPSPAPEVGWQRWAVAAHPLAQAWFGTEPPARVFHWHYEAFTLPPGAVHLAGSAACPHQAFAIGPHLAMQFHVEVDAAKLDRWAADAETDGGDRYRRAVAAGVATVQGGAAMREAAALAAQQRLADAIYTRWLSAAGG